MKKRMIALVLSVFMVLNPLTSYAAAPDTTEVPETTAVTNTAAETVAVADRFLLNYQEISINMDSGYPLPLYLTTGYYTEPSGTGKITWSSTDESVAAVDGEGRVTAVTG